VRFAYDPSLLKGAAVISQGGFGVLGSAADQTVALSGELGVAALGFERTCLAALDSFADFLPHGSPGKSDRNGSQDRSKRMNQVIETLGHNRCVLNVAGAFCLGNVLNQARDILGPPLSPMNVRTAIRSAPSGVAAYFLIVAVQWSR